MNKKVFRNLSYGVYVVSTLDGTRPTGCTANSVMQITSEPASIAISINHDNYTNGCIAKTGTFAVSILSEDSDPGLIGTFGFQSGKDVDKFDGTAHTIRDGMPVLDDCCGYIVCRVIDKMETSTHTVFLGEVTDGDVLETAPAMTYAYYHNVIKGKSPKNAPPIFRKKKRPSLRPAGCATSADTCMTARFPSKNCRRTIPARYAGSQNPNSSGNKCEQNVKGDVDLLQRSTSPFTFCSHFS